MKVKQETVHVQRWLTFKRENVEDEEDEVVFMRAKASGRQWLVLLRHR